MQWLPAPRPAAQHQHFNQLTALQHDLPTHQASSKRAIQPREARRLPRGRRTRRASPLPEVPPSGTTLLPPPPPAPLSALPAAGSGRGAHTHSQSLWEARGWCGCQALSAEAGRPASWGWRAAVHLHPFSLCQVSLRSKQPTALR